MEGKKPEEVFRDSTVRVLHVAPRVRAVPPLTDAEILALRKLLVDAETIKESCPVARRALSDR
jgi:hypothetical protein